MRLNRFMIRPLVEQGLREELNAGDTTGGFLVWDEDPVQTYTGVGVWFSGCIDASVFDPGCRFQAISALRRATSAAS